MKIYLLPVVKSDKNIYGMIKLFNRVIVVVDIKISTYGKHMKQQEEMVTIISTLSFDNGLQQA